MDVNSDEVKQKRQRRGTQPTIVIYQAQTRPATETTISLAFNHSAGAGRRTNINWCAQRST